MTRCSVSIKYARVISDPQSPVYSKRELDVQWPVAASAHSDANASAHSDANASAHADAFAHSDADASYTDLTAFLGRFTQLEALHIHVHPEKTRIDIRVPTLQTLKTLTLTTHMFGGPQIALHVADLPELRTLDVARSCITHLHLRALPNLRAIDCRDCEQLLMLDMGTPVPARSKDQDSDDDIEDSDPSPATAPNLETVDCDGCNDLSHLDLRGSNRLTSLSAGSWGLYVYKDEKKQRSVLLLPDDLSQLTSLTTKSFRVAKKVLAIERPQLKTLSICTVTRGNDPQGGNGHQVVSWCERCPMLTHLTLGIVWGGYYALQVAKRHQVPNLIYICVKEGTWGDVGDLKAYLEDEAIKGFLNRLEGLQYWELRKTWMRTADMLLFGAVGLPSLRKTDIGLQWDNAMSMPWRR